MGLGGTYDVVKELGPPRKVEEKMVLICSLGVEMPALCDESMIGEELVPENEIEDTNIDREVDPRVCADREDSIRATGTELPPESEADEVDKEAEVAGFDDVSAARLIAAAAEAAEAAADASATLAS
jgi:hypothetical protein